MSCNFPDCIDGVLGSRLMKTLCPQCGSEPRPEEKLFTASSDELSQAAVERAFDAVKDDKVVEINTGVEPVELAHTSVNFSVDLGETVPVDEKING